ncbi:MAG: nucleotidyltransferase domain-containing protein [Candidatus Hatepunaea meridiana]|nr:nucleotidyltransferase domain-containing protein [Candidatus Hatepunaea meridiana]
MLAQVDKTKLQIICRKWKIKELAVFGSVLRGDFKSESDVDVTVTFSEDAHWGLWDFYNLRDELQVLFDREVDLVEPDGIINPIRRRNILNNRQVIYAA